MENEIKKQTSINAIPVEQYKTKQTNGLAIASMVLGIAGWVLCAGGGIGSLVSPQKGHSCPVILKY